MNKTLKKALEYANTKKIKNVIIIGEEEVKERSVTIKDIKDFKQYKASWDKEKDKVLGIIGAVKHE